MRRSLLGGEVGFDLADGVSPEQKSPQVAIAAVKEGGGREASSTPSDATKEVLSIDDRGRAAADGDPNNGRQFGAANSLAPNDLSTR